MKVREQKINTPIMRKRKEDDFAGKLLIQNPKIFDTTDQPIIDALVAASKKRYEDNFYKRFDIIKSNCEDLLRKNDFVFTILSLENIDEISDQGIKKLKDICNLPIGDKYPDSFITEYAIDNQKIVRELLPLCQNDQDIKDIHTLMSSGLKNYEAKCIIDAVKEDKKTLSEILDCEKDEFTISGRPDNVYEKQDIDQER